MALSTKLEQNFLISMETHKTQKSQNNLEKGQNYKHQSPWPQTILQSYSNQKNMGLA